MHFDGQIEAPQSQKTLNVSAAVPLLNVREISPVVEESHRRGRYIFLRHSD
jgi:hypothetical protein